MQQGIVTKARAKLRNLAQINTPTLELWDVNPDNLGNMVDGLSSTITGIGSKVLSEAGNAGIIKYDLGSEKGFLATIMAGIGASAGTTTVYLDVSNSADFSSPFTVSLTTANGTYETLKHGLHNGRGRYVRFRFYVNSASTLQARIYDLGLWELG